MLGWLSRRNDGLRQQLVNQYIYMLSLYIITRQYPTSPGTGTDPSPLAGPTRSEASAGLPQSEMDLASSARRSPPLCSYQVDLWMASDTPFNSAALPSVTRYRLFSPGRLGGASCAVSYPSHPKAAQAPRIKNECPSEHAKLEDSASATYLLPGVVHSCIQLTRLQQR